MNQSTPKASAYLPHRGVLKGAVECRAFWIPISILPIGLDDVEI
jgi:hypothetical protein